MRKEQKQYLDLEILLPHSLELVLVFVRLQQSLSLVQCKL